MPVEDQSVGMLALGFALTLMRLQSPSQFLNVFPDLILHSRTKRIGEELELNGGEKVMLLINLCLVVLLGDNLVDVMVGHKHWVKYNQVKMPPAACIIKPHALLTVAEGGRILTMDKNSLVAIIRGVLDFEFASCVSEDVIEEERMCIRFREEIVGVLNELFAQRVDAFLKLVHVQVSQITPSKYPGARRKMSLGDDNIGP